MINFGCEQKTNDYSSERRGFVVRNIYMGGLMAYVDGWVYDMSEVKAG